MRMRIITFLLALATSVLAGCGGGGGGLLAGIDRLGISSGTVTGFGSVIVNGVRYETTAQTEFRVDDNAGTQADLQVGQQVTVRWSSSDDGVTRTATRIDYDAVVKGPVTPGSIDTVAGTFVVLGQTVRVTGTTSFDSGITPRDITGLSDGQFVAVSGFVDATGRIRATRIEPRAAGQIEVRGVAATVTAQTFQIGALTIVYTGAVLPDGPITNGDLVEARGTTIDGLGRLVATEVEREDDFADAAVDRDDAELEGLITVVNSVVGVTADFVVDGVRVTASAQTTFEDGTAADIRVNARVEVEGVVNASGVLVARRVEFESFDDDGDGDDDALDGRVEANVTSVNSGAGTVVAAGVTIRVSAATRFEDQRSDVRPFTLANVVVGDYIEVRGTPGTGAQLDALVFERDAASTLGRLRGPAGAVANPTLTVLGVVVTTTSGLGGTVFRDDDGNVIDQATFFAALAAGSEVSVRFVQGGPVIATEAQLEDDADGDGSGDDDDLGDG